MRTKEEIQKDIKATNEAISKLYNQLSNDRRFLNTLEDELHKLEKGWGLDSEIEVDGIRGIVVYGGAYNSYRLRPFKKDGSPGSATRHIYGGVKVIKP